VVPDVNDGVEPDNIIYSYGVIPPLSAKLTLPVPPEHNIGDVIDDVAEIAVGGVLLIAYGVIVQLV
jgi:hypothetical protein